MQVLVRATFFDRTELPPDTEGDDAPTLVPRGDVQRADEQLDADHLVPAPERPIGVAPRDISETLSDFNQAYDLAVFAVLPQFLEVHVFLKSGQSRPVRPEYE